MRKGWDPILIVLISEFGSLNFNCPRSIADRYFDGPVIYPFGHGISCEHSPHTHTPHTPLPPSSSAQCIPV